MLLPEPKSEKKKVTFRPPDLLEVNEKDPKFRYRWIKADNRRSFYNGIDQRGWEVVRYGSKASENNAALTGLFSQFATTTIGTIMRIGDDLVLARMPKEKAQARNDYYVQKSRDMVKSIKNAKRDIRDADKDMFVGETKSWKEARL